MCIRDSDRTLGLKTEKLEDNLAKEWKSAKTRTTLNETPLHDDEHRTSFTYTTWNNSTDTLMKKQEERPVESASCSQLSIATIKAEEDLLYQDYINSGRESSSPEISPLNNTTSLPFFPGDNMSDSSGEYEERTSLSPVSYTHLDVYKRQLYLHLSFYRIHRCIQHHHRQAP